MDRIKLEKYINTNNYKTFYLKRDNEEKKLTISFEGNLDLYFSLSNFNNEPYFIIDKSNYIIYELFDNLYNDVKNCNIYNDSEIYKDYKNRYEYKELFKNNIITWKCDDYPIEIAPSFNIIKEKDKYIIKFNPIIKNEEFSNMFMFQLKNRISIRIRNCGSRYHPFNLIFMKLYNSLSKLDEIDLEQIHIEEYLLEKRKKLIK